MRKLALVAVLAVIAFGATAQAADPVKIRIGWVVMPGELQPVLFAKEGIAKNNGKTYIMEPVRFQG